MVVFGQLPAEIIVDILLPLRIRDVVLAADNVGNAQQVIVHDDREIHHRIDLCVL